MTEQAREKLQAIRTFPQLVKYLRDELDWPIEPEDFEDLFFEYDAEELGIDAKTAAKIDKIKQLRPLVSGQPWGVFFVKFEPKRLPVVALRRILGQLVIKKRSSARQAGQAAWHLHDLLFISNYGEGDHRQITFAHFTQDEVMGDLPALKVLGWDDADTALHIDHVHQTLKDSLRWPEDDTNLEGWRKQWSSAFTIRHGEVITTSKGLSIRLAQLATEIRKRVNTILAVETEKGPLRKLMKAFKEALIHDLSEDDFADMYAQTITYGLLSARVSRPAGLVADNITDMVPVTNPFLKDLLGTFLTVGGRKGKINFDEVGINDVVQTLREANMEAVLRDFGDRNPQEDPVVHFYELFLKEYDPKKRMQRGVFYTPRPVVSYIVRSVHELLQTEFGLPDGLADTTTWGEMAKKFPPLPVGEGRGEGGTGLTIPQGVKPTDPFVTILDPATGTGTFLVEAIDVIYNTMKSRWLKEGHNEKEIPRLWNQYVPNHLLPRLYGFELMMAPYAVAHMKVGLKLYETGYRFESNQRSRIFLTNSLEPASDAKKQLEFEEWAPALAHEAEAVNEIKQKNRFTVVIGNPPYSLLSANLELHHRALVEDYKFISGKRIRERGALQLEKNLNDDYVKFVRFTQLLTAEAGVGCSGLVTNHSFLDNPTMRGMRWSLLASSSRLWVNDLHGNSTKKEQPPSGCNNVNIFQIKQGVAITLMVCLPISTFTCEAKHHERWGTQKDKEAWLAANHVGSHEWQSLTPSSDLYLFIPQSNPLKYEFEVWPSLQKAMPINGAGYITARDNLVVDFDRDTLINRIRAFNASNKDDESLLKEFNVADKKGWDVRRARMGLKHVDIESKLIKTNYRPFDSRWIFFDSTLVWGRSWPTMQHVVGQTRNLTMLATRMTKDKWDVWVARTVSSHKAMSAYDTNSVFPLYLVEDLENSQRSISNEYSVNLATPFVKSLAGTLGFPTVGPHKLPTGLTPEDIFHYIYAVFYSPGYRIRYVDFLRVDFPHLPLPRSIDLFRSLVRIGGNLVALHLMESPKLKRPITAYLGTKTPEIGRVGWSDDTVWLDATATKKGQPAKPGTIGFHGVSEAVYNFHVGGYQVCEKWLKDRKGRTLSADDIAHYQKIVVALNETIRLMAEIDKVINAHGGWPDAFKTYHDDKSMTYEEEPFVYLKAAEKKPIFGNPHKKSKSYV